MDIQLRTSFDFQNLNNPSVTPTKWFFFKAQKRAFFATKNVVMFEGEKVVQCHFVRRSPRKFTEREIGVIPFVSVDDQIVYLTGLDL